MWIVRAWRVILGIVIGAGLLAGCAADRPRRGADIECTAQEPTCPAAATVASTIGGRMVRPRSLIFDAQAGPFYAGDFTWRSTWPSTESMYVPGEVIYYREHFRDLQGPGINRPDSTYRRFDTYRYGAGYR